MVELLTLGQHLCPRPNHLHVVVDARELYNVAIALHPEGNPYLSSGIIFSAVRRNILIGEYAPSTGRGRLGPSCQARPQGMPTTTLCLPFPSFGTVFVFPR